MSDTAVDVIRILFADDSVADAELALLEIERAGLSVSTRMVVAEDDFEAALTSETFDIVLTDFRMMGWSGLDALRAVQRRGLDIPVILITGTLGDELAVECVKAGVTDYVLKDHLTRLPLVIDRALKEARAHRERQLVEERFAELAATTSDVFFVVDTTTRKTIYINAAYETIWGRSREPLYRAGPEAFLEGIPEEDGVRVLASMERILSGIRDDETEFRVVRPDGEVRWVVGRAVPIFDEKGTVVRMSGITRDITERKRAEQHLRESEERYRAVADASFDGIAVTIDGRIVEANRGFADIFGYSLDEIIGKSATEFLAPESLPLIAGRTESTKGMLELIGLRKDGTRITLETTGRAHQVAGVIGRISAIRDVTQKRALEAQFRQAQKMEAIGRLASGVAHDFNNLLTIILGSAALVVDDLPKGHPSLEDMLAILDAGKSASALTRQLLAFSRQQAVVPKLIALDSAVHHARSMIERLIGDDVRLVTVQGDTQAYVMMDAGQLEQVILNLVVNARDAMPAGGMLRIETGPVDVSGKVISPHVAEATGHFARLVVADTGMGMSAETQAHLFEPFFTTKESGKGTGLGLSTVYGIVKQAGGFIEVDSVVGKGTTFGIHLPLAEHET